MGLVERLAPLKGEHRCAGSPLKDPDSSGSLKGFAVGNADSLERSDLPPFNAKVSFQPQNTGHLPRYFLARARFFSRLANSLLRFLIAALRESRTGLVEVTSGESSISSALGVGGGVGFGGGSNSSLYSGVDLSSKEVVDRELDIKSSRF